MKRKRTIKNQFSFSNNVFQLIKSILELACTWLLYKPTLEKLKKQLSISNMLLSLIQIVFLLTLVLEKFSTKQLKIQILQFLTTNLSLKMILSIIKLFANLEQSTLKKEIWKKQLNTSKLVCLFNQSTCRDQSAWEIYFLNSATQAQLQSIINRPLNITQEKSKQ